MKEYEDVKFIPIEENVSVEEDTSFSRYKEEKEQQEKRTRKSFFKTGIKILLIFFGIIFLSPILLGCVAVIGGLGIATVAGSVAVAIGGVAALIGAVFLMSGGWTSLGVFCLFVTMGCISVVGLIITCCIWILRSIWRFFRGKYVAWKYKYVEGEV